MPDPLRADRHVHSRFSDGEGTLAENIAAAEAVGLTGLTCVDHVRVSTEWVPDYVEAVRTAAGTTGLDLGCGIEAKILDTAGALDLPADIGGVDLLYAADHQVPGPDGPRHPREVEAAIAAGELAAADVVQDIVRATAASVRRYDHVLIAHLFSVLPKIGVDEGDVPLELVDELARAAVDGGAIIEVSERWRCPTVRTLRPFLDHGVPLVASTDSHRPATIGRYDYCAAVVAELRPAAAA
jgi:putative hydrolase